MPLHVPVGVQHMPVPSHSVAPPVQLLWVQVVLLPEQLDTGP
jgi:hypothetical protein